MTDSYIILDNFLVFDYFLFHLIKPCAAKAVRLKRYSQMRFPVVVTDCMHIYQYSGKLSKDYGICICIKCDLNDYF